MTINDFNLLVTTARGNEDDACSEIWFLLGKLGDRESIVDKTGISGLITAKTALNPFEAIEELKRMLREQPEEFRYILRVIPVEMVIRTNLGEIQRAVNKLSAKIGENESFRITVEKRHTGLSTRSIIEAAAANIERTVNLDNPYRIVLIEVLGGLTGISVVKPEDVLSVMKERV